MLNYKRKFIYSAYLAVVAGLLSGCATSAPSFGDQITQQGNSTAGLGESWNRGEELIKEGQELVNDGQSNVSNGESSMSDGRSKIAQGEQMCRETEERYSQLYPASQMPSGS